MKLRPACSPIRFGSWLEEMRTEGRKWQTPIICLCSCWNGVYCVWQSCRALSRGWDGSVIAVQSATERKTETKILSWVYFCCCCRLFPLQILIDSLKSKFYCVMCTNGLNNIPTYLRELYLTTYSTYITPYALREALWVGGILHGSICQQSINGCVSGWKLVCVVKWVIRLKQR